MLNDALQFLLRIVVDLAASALWLRFYMQWARVPFHNPLAQFVVRATDFAVRPTRRLVPGLFGLDLATLLLFFAVQLAGSLFSLLLIGYPFIAAGLAVLPGYLLMALASGLKLVIYLSIGLVLIQAAISWINPYAPTAPVFYALSRPLLAPFQRILPTFHGVDLSPIALFVLLQLLLIAPIAGLERLARSMVF